MPLKILDNDLFGQALPPQKEQNNKGESVLTTPEIEKRINFFGYGLADILQQGPIRRIPKMNDKTTNEEPLTPEMEAQIKEIFGENYEHISL